MPEPAPPPDPVQTADVALLGDLLHTLARAEDRSEAFQFALDRTCPAVGAALGSVFLIDGASELMRLVAAHAWPARWRPWLGEMRVRVGFGPSGEAVSERRTIEVPDVFADPGLEDWQEVARELGFHSLVALPLQSHRAVHGAATFYFAETGTPAPRVRTLLRAVADTLAAMAEQAELRDRNRRLTAELEDQHPAGEPRTRDTESTPE